MDQSISRKRPWFAALLGFLVTGLGHIYLRRWFRAIGWMLVVMVVSSLFVEPATVEAMWNGEAVDLRELAPVLLVVTISVADAYALARTQNARSRGALAEAGAADSTTPETEGEAPEEAVTCPNCGRDVDPELEFCHWCTTKFDSLEENGRTDD
ncbi:DUF6677 family protein [Natrialbaceae archaeon GCM10025810]|uniref:DUF6677 family protein n=1 Tax=Halovalidus salilacus TaxID=3075124 RepID=UPI00361B5919